MVNLWERQIRELQKTSATMIHMANKMIRVVKTTEGTIVPDTTGRMNGRGAYVCSLECLGNAMKNKGLSRSLKAEIPSEVYEQLKEAFAKIEQSK